jgi:hypothetical protein
VPTSKRPQIIYAQYPRIPSRILKSASNEEVVDDVVDEVCNVQGWLTMKPKNLLILSVWTVEIPRYSAHLQGVWQSHSRHADLKKVSNQKAHKHPEVLGRAIRRAPHMEAFIPDV